MDLPYFIEASEGQLYSVIKETAIRSGPEEDQFVNKIPESV
jgi:hypothetical protein